LKEDGGQWQWVEDNGQWTVDNGQMDAINKRNHLFSGWPEYKYGNKRGINHLLIK
jgi:hypothetical protein